MAYRFLLFDADHTLLDFPADMTAAFRGFCRDLGYGGGEEEVAALQEIYEKYNNKWWGLFERGECTKPQLFRQRFVDFLAETGLSGDPEEMHRVYFDHLARGGRTYPGARELLQELSRRAEIYLITNGNAASQVSRMDNSGLMPFVRAMFVSEDVGVGKPDRRYFDYVAAHIPGYDPALAIVIGDSMASDIQGAENAGLDSILYCPPDRALPEKPLPPRCRLARSYGEIARILE